MRFILFIYLLLCAPHVFSISHTQTPYPLEKSRTSSICLHEFTTREQGLITPTPDRLSAINSHYKKSLSYLSDLVLFYNKFLYLRPSYGVKNLDVIQTEYVRLIPMQNHLEYHLRLALLIEQEKNSRGWESENVLTPFQQKHFLSCNPGWQKMIIFTHRGLGVFQYIVQKFHMQMVFILLPSARNTGQSRAIFQKILESPNFQNTPVLVQSRLSASCVPFLIKIGFVPPTLLNNNLSNATVIFRYTPESLKESEETIHFFPYSGRKVLLGHLFNESSQ